MRVGVSFALLTLCSLSASMAADGGPYGTRGKVPGHVSVQLIPASANSRAQTFVFRNDATIPVTYLYRGDKGTAPVPFCRNKEGAVRVCAIRESSGAASYPGAMDRDLQPQVVVLFEAYPGRGEIVGVQLSLGGERTMLWAGTDVMPNISLQADRER